MFSSRWPFSSEPSGWGPAVYAVLLFSALQLTTAFVEAAYSFGLLATDVPPAVGAVALAFIAPLALLPWKRLPRGSVRVLGVAVLVVNVLEPRLSPLPRVIVAGLGVACALSALPAIIARSPIGGTAAGAGMALALVGWAAARTMGAGIDATRVMPGWALRFVLLIAWVLLPLGEEDAAASDAGFGTTLVLALGATLTLALPLLGLFLPDDMARWSAQPSAAMAALAGGGLCAWLAWSAWKASLPRVALVVLAALLTVSLAATLVPQQVAFPTNPGGYPLAAPDGKPLAAFPMALLCGAIAVLHGALVGELRRLRPAPRKLAGAFAIAGLVLLLVIAAQILTSIYDYVPVVGPLFRDRFWLVMAVPAAGAATCALAVRGRDEPLPRRAALIIAGVAAALTIVAAVAPLARARHPSDAPADEVRFVSFNIQQGFDVEGRKNLEAQLDVLRQLRPDVIGLQESDSVRIAGGHDDFVRYFAERLDMHSYPGPTPVVGTFGIGLLSRFPIETARTVFLRSSGEQTAAIIARLHNGITVVVTHLGNDGPIEQQENLLAALTAEPGPLFVMGDFNFTRGSEQHRITVSHPGVKLRNAWDRPGVRGVPAGTGEENAIDHLFVSPAVEISDVQYRSGLASDHPALLVTCRP